MKKNLIIFFVLILLIPFKVNAENGLAENVKSAILLEPTTGIVLYEKNAHERLAPASMTKMMTLLLTFEALDRNDINLDDLVNVSTNASGMGGSQMFLQPNMKIKVTDLIKGIAVASGNDASVAIAEYIAGTEGAFVEMMNNKVEELKLGNTHFANVHGLDNEAHYSSAYDMAHIGMELLKHKEVLKYTGIYEETFKKPDGTNVWLVNSNKLVRFESGIDGLKTGYTRNAKYCLTATGTRNNMRLLSTVMGAESSELRNKDTMGLLNYGFSNYKFKTIIKENETLKEIKDDMAKEKKINVIIQENITNLTKTTEKDKSYTYNIKMNKYKLPIDQNTVIGNVEILENGKLIKTVNAYSKYNVHKYSFTEVFKHVLKEIFNGKLFF